MSKKKTKKKKLVLKEKKLAREELKKLENLRDELEQELLLCKKKQVKDLRIRNLRIFKDTLNLLMPFAVSFGLVAGVFCLFGGGAPFYLDDVKKYKIYDMDYNQSGCITKNIEYETNRWFDDSIGASELTIYTPWEKENEQYVRYKREYNLGDLTTLELFTAIEEENYEYIKETLKDYKEEKQISNQISKEKENKNYIEASLHMIDEDDSLEYKETIKKNMIITIVEIALSLACGLIATHLRDFDFISEVKSENELYKCSLINLNNIENLLEETNQKILSLNKEVKSNAK